MDQEKLADMLNIQFNEDQYFYCLTLYQAAAGMSMPVENPETREIQIEGHGTIAFTDLPMNRGLLAVSKELTDQGMGQREHMAMLSRVMHFGNILEAKDRFARWFQPSSEQDSLLIDEAIMRAGAKARLVVSEDYMGFDLDDVERCANEIAQRLDEEDSRAQ